ncbi:MAG: TonB family protein [Rhodanobacteraceae bacterium]
MIAETVAYLGSATLAISAAIFANLVLRNPVRRHFGAQTAFALWSLIPLAAIATLLPAPTVPDGVNAVLVLHALTRAPALSATLSSAPDSIAWMFWIWLTGVAAATSLLTWQQRRFMRDLGRLARSDGDVWHSDRAVSGPALIGALRPRIVLPADFVSRYTPRERDLIVAHEQAHHARGDAQLNLLAAVLRCVFWFNPLLHFAMARFRLDQELACDAAVIARFPNARRSYADAMLKTHLTANALPIGCQWHADHPLKERITMLKFPLPARSRRAWGLLFVCLFGAAASYVAWAAQPPRALAASGKSADRVVDAQLVVTVGKEAPKALRLVNPLDQPFMAKGEGASPWQADFIASAAADGNIKLAMVLQQGGVTIGKPTIVVEPNKPASVKVNGADGQTSFRIDATLALHDAGWQPPEASVATATSAPIGPHYRHLSPPRYPTAAIRDDIEGVEFVDAPVGSDGRVESARVDHVEPASAAALGDASIAAVKIWTFDPAMRGGIAVSGTAPIPIRYTINRNGSVAPPGSQLATPPGALETIDVVGARSPLKRG